MSQEKQTAIIAGLTILAIIVGPLLALWLQRLAENRRERKQGKLWIFKTLMMYRATPLAYPYVQALNLIDVSFHADNDKEKAVRAAWNTLLDHLTVHKGQPDFLENTRTLTATLLAAMGKCLGYEFEEVYLKRHAYQPEGHGKLEEEQQELRGLLLQVLRNDRRIPIALFPDDFHPIVLPPNEVMPIKKLPG
ncbi:MAG: DUF6680 family protein [Candidatus Korobacteraceae bacterium]|jgi:hypothetical protein